MTRNLKALGLALVAVFAMSAVAASGAMAASHHFDVLGTISAHAENEQIFEPVTGGGAFFACKEVKVNNGRAMEAPLGVIGEPEYSECRASTGGGEPVNAKVSSNGCEYTFKGVTTPGNLTENGEHATVNIECPEGAKIEIRVTALNLKCAAVGAQDIPHAVRYHEDEEPGANPEEDTTIEATAHGFENEEFGGVANCSGTGGTVVNEDGSYTGNVTVHNVRLTTNQTP